MSHKMNVINVCQRHVIILIMIHNATHKDSYSYLVLPEDPHVAVDVAAQLRSAELVDSAGGEAGGDEVGTQDGAEDGLQGDAGHSLHCSSYSDDSAQCDQKNNAAVVVVGVPDVSQDVLTSPDDLVWQVVDISLYLGVQHSQCLPSEGQLLIVQPAVVLRTVVAVI